MVEPIVANLSKDDFDRIFKYFDRNNDGVIRYDEFLRGIRGPLNDFRKGFVLIAFQKLDKTGEGIVDINDLAGAYDVSFHPKFKDGSMTKEEVLSEFMEQWDTCQKDGKVTFEEFCEYYTDVSASIDTDKYFELMMRNAWHIAGGEGAAAAEGVQRHCGSAPAHMYAVRSKKWRLACPASKGSRPPRKRSDRRLIIRQP